MAPPAAAAETTVLPEAIPLQAGGGVGFHDRSDNLANWQTSKTRVQRLSEGPPPEGFRVREGTKPARAREFEQVVGFTEFDRPNRLHVHIVEGPVPVDGTWVLQATEQGTKGDSTAVDALPRSRSGR